MDKQIIHSIPAFHHVASMFFIILLVPPCILFPFSFSFPFLHLSHPWSGLPNHLWVSVVSCIQLSSRFLHTSETDSAN
ncbi:hypothetical protein DUNSADRAFT_16848 [Dunaliella salina]|uniref:Uncharacterized protein n=1 Tax=Dunaliella salina TaxID=3046 RepID=A0ABQ7G2S3_DUNSA|nr:hypothetical protein DUNSADRAFT_16848 [Dunaliella salina]|eukprot:KAF5828903.1 hypothetical protein DUNSADRAFT_16848 [Dunaliella salina]